jgi:hypothetical protein
VESVPACVKLQPALALLFQRRAAHGPGAAGGAGQQGNAGAEGMQQRTTLLGLVQLLPILLILGFTFFSGSQSPPYSLSQEASYRVEVTTSRLATPFYVRSMAELERAYPTNSAARYRLERQVSRAAAAVTPRCQQHAHRACCGAVSVTKRHAVGVQVEASHYERLEARCQQERLMRHRAWSWGNREQVGEGRDVCVACMSARTVR